MIEYLKEELKDFLNKKYCGIEDALGEQDITKEEFKKVEDKLGELGNVMGLGSFYPFK